MPVADLGLKEKCHAPVQLAALALPGEDVLAYASLIEVRKNQLATGRPSYVNGVLIQSRGELCVPACERCTKAGSKPFLECRRLKGYWNGACGNCKYVDGARTCTVAIEGEKPDETGTVRDYTAADMAQDRGLPSGTQENPMIVPDDDD